MRRSTKPFRRHNPNTYRSGLEDSLAAQLRAAGVSFEYEKVKLPYVPIKASKYTPDFFLENGIVIESKGLFVSADRSKHLLIQAQHPDIDIRFVFSRANNRIGKKSTTTYSRWAEDHGFPWADGHIPSAWLREPPNIKSLKAIEALHGKSPDARAREAHT